jgi:hypothetical protein
MIAQFKKYLLEKPNLDHSLFRYIFLIILSGLFILMIVHWIWIDRNQSKADFGLMIVPAMLLFNHLACRFAWSRYMAIALRFMSACITAIAIPYIVYTLFTR